MDTGLHQLSSAILAPPLNRWAIAVLMVAVSKALPLNAMRPVASGSLQKDHVWIVLPLVLLTFLGKAKLMLMI